MLLHDFKRTGTLGGTPNLALSTHDRMGGLRNPKARTRSDTNYRYSLDRARSVQHNVALYYPLAIGNLV
jgi:hypothetical protein